MSDLMYVGLGVVISCCVFIGIGIVRLIIKVNRMSNDIKSNTKECEDLNLSMNESMRGIYECIDELKADVNSNINGIYSTIDSKYDQLINKFKLAKK
jgi:hypothetical protein